MSSSRASSWGGGSSGSSSAASSASASAASASAAFPSAAPSYAYRSAPSTFDASSHEPRPHLVDIPSSLRFSSGGDSSERRSAFHSLCSSRAGSDSAQAAAAASSGSDAEESSDRVKTAMTSSASASEWLDSFRGASISAASSRVQSLERVASNPTPTAKTPLLSLQSASPSFSGGYNGVHSSSPALLTPQWSTPSSSQTRTTLDPTNSFMHYTPHTRRAMLQRKIDLLKSSNARARKNASCWRLCGLSRNPFTAEGMLVAALVASVALCSAGEQVTRKLLTASLMSHRWFLFELVAVMTFLLALIAAFLHRASIRNHIKHHGVAWKFFLCAGLLDAVSALGVMLSVAPLPPSWGVALPALTVPIAVLFRFFATNGERTSMVAAIGCVVTVLAAAGCIVTPDLIGFSSECAPFVGGGEANQERAFDDMLLSLLVLVISLIPSAACAIYRQSWLQQNASNAQLTALATASVVMISGAVLGPLALVAQGFLGVPARHQGGDALPFPSALQPTPVSGHGSSSSAAPPAFSPRDPQSPGELDPVSLGREVYTSGAGLNVLENFRSGLQCAVLGRDEAGSGNACARLFPAHLIELCVFLCCIVGTQFLLSHLMRRSRDERTVAGALTAGVCAALLAFQSPLLQSLLPSWELGRCILTDPRTVAMGVILLAFGLTLAQSAPSESPLDLNVWARLEEIAKQEEDEQNRRQRQQARHGTGTRRV